MRVLPTDAVTLHLCFGFLKMLYQRRCLADLCVESPAIHCGHGSPEFSVITSYPNSNWHTWIALEYSLDFLLLRPYQGLALPACILSLKIELQTEPIGQSCQVIK